MKIFKVSSLRQVLKQLFLGFGTVAIAQLALFTNPSFAAPNTLTLSVYPLGSRGTFPICPTEFSLTQTSRPYYEGGYTIDGSASLGWFAKPFKMEASDAFSVTWMAELQTKYRNCQASAIVTKINDKPFQGHSYLRMRFINGKAYLILDMTGMRDANSLTTVIIKQDVKNGNPIWSWSGTD
ncbi:MAG: hypothetical protein LH649_08865 [Pseudanabaena sp. CAN_BIN31]|nr:hypothetical protein [Pseudanabaena sp. CAN_BIN31]